MAQVFDRLQSLARVLIRRMTVDEREVCEKRGELERLLDVTDLPRLNDLLKMSEFSIQSMTGGSLETPRFEKVVRLLNGTPSARVDFLGMDMFKIRGPYAVRYALDGEPRTIYIKSGWYGIEGPLVEALGITLHNLLSGEQRRYLCNPEFIVMSPVEGKFLCCFTETEKVEIDNYAYSLAYGRWYVFTRALGLGDRRNENVLWDGENLNNIDFGYLFTPRYYYVTSNHHPFTFVALNNEAVERGKKEAEQTVRQNARQNLDQLLRILTLVPFAVGHGFNRSYTGLYPTEFLSEHCSLLEYVPELRQRLL